MDRLRYVHVVDESDEVASSAYLRSRISRQTEYQAFPRILRLDQLNSNGTARVGGVASLRNSAPGPGRVEAILLRPGRREPTVSVNSVEIEPGFGLAGDHFAGGAGSKRQVTLIAREDLDAIASFLKIDEVEHASTRRNILTSGINLHALKNRTFRVGTALLEYAGQCSPCSLMEQTVGPGAYQAMRYRGGIIARVLERGVVQIGDSIRFEAEILKD